MLSFDKEAELRDSILGNYETLLQQQTENAINNWDIDVSALTQKNAIGYWFNGLSRRNGRNCKRMVVRDRMGGGHWGSVLREQ